MSELYPISKLLLLKRSNDEIATSSCGRDQDYIGKIEELQAHLDKVNNIIQPGCSQEVLDVALGLVSALANILSGMLPIQKTHSSL